MDLESSVSTWAQRESTIAALIMIGSRSRICSDVAGATPNSDWDFQVICSRPQLFHNSSWLVQVGIRPIAYVVRSGRLGSALKVSVVSSRGDLDLVIIPKWQFSIARLCVAWNLPLTHSMTRGFTDLAAVHRSGFRVLKGNRALSEFFSELIRGFPPERLDTNELLSLAEGFVCDYVSTKKKILRGELIAAQRWLHQYLVETNLRLIQELACRKGIPAFPDGRRLEFTLPDQLLQLASAESELDRDTLEREVNTLAIKFSLLMHELVGDKWTWPESILILQPKSAYH